MADTKVLSIRGDGKQVDALKRQVDQLVEDRGLKSQSEVLPIISDALSEAAGPKVAPAVAAWSKAHADALRAATAQMDAVIAAYGELEDATDAKWQRKVDTLNATIEESRSALAEARDELAETKESEERARAEADKRVRDVEAKLAEARDETEDARKAEAEAVARAEQAEATLRRLVEKIPQLSADGE